MTENSLAALSWLSGYWTGLQDGIAMEELWLPPSGNLLLALHRDTFPTGKTFFEFLRIEHSAEGIVYFASPAGSPPTPFRLAELTDNRAVFANPDHSFPQRIIYRRDGDRLHARVEGVAGGTTQSEEWTWTRTGLPPDRSAGE